MKRVLSLALCLIALGIIGCPRNLPVKIPGITGRQPSDEEQIAAVLDDVQRGMQMRRIYKVIAHVSRTYHDAEGRDYEGIQTYLNTIFKKYRVVRIDRADPRIIVQGDRARAIETFGTTAEPIDPNTDAPIHLQGQVAVILERVGSEWQIVEWAVTQ